MHVIKRASILFLTTIIIAASFTGCSERANSEVSDSPYQGMPTQKVTGIIEEFTTSSDLETMIADFNAQNNDTVGWLVVPNTDINDVVVWSPESNDYYLRLDFYKNYQFNGVYFADYRATFGDGTREELAPNTCIYGHSISDDPTDDRYQIKFGQLHNFRDIEFAKATPYIIFATEDEVMVWEIFAVFMGDMNKFAYNRSDLSQEEFYKVVKEDVLPRSIYNYSASPKATDKFLTLSTCIYELPDGIDTGYPDTYYRYGIMARLLDEDARLKDTAKLSVNRKFQQDIDGYPK